MTDLLNAINPWHLIFDFVGWCVVAVIALWLGVLIGVGLVGIVRVAFAKWRGR